MITRILQIMGLTNLTDDQVAESDRHGLGTKSLAVVAKATAPLFLVLLAIELGSGSGAGLHGLLRPPPPPETIAEFRVTVQTSDEHKDVGEFYASILLNGKPIDVKRWEWSEHSLVKTLDLKLKPQQTIEVKPNEYPIYTATIGSDNSKAERIVFRVEAITSEGRRLVPSGRIENRSNDRELSWQWNDWRSEAGTPGPSYAFGRY